MKQKMSLSIEQRHVRHLQRCAQRSTGGNVSAYIERLLAQDELRQAVTAATRWYATHPDYAKDSEAEAQAALDKNPGGLLAIRIGQHGWAFAMELDRPLRSRLTQKAGEASPQEMEAVDQALRALLEL